MEKNRPTEIVVLCGGKGMRLAPALPEELPKCLAPIGDRPFLDILLEQIEKEFLDRKIILAAGHNIEAVKAFAKDRKWGNELEVFNDTEQGGTAQIAYQLTMRSMSADTMFINGDTWQDESLKSILEYHKNDWYTPITVSINSGAYPAQPRGVFVLNKQYISAWKHLFQCNNLDAKFLMVASRCIGAVKLCFSEKPFYDIGTPEALEYFKAFWAQSHSPCSDFEQNHIANR